jgi:diguanylate cyclase (GGDEF)-like protein/PAS domain S-box-containing protein
MHTGKPYQLTGAKANFDLLPDPVFAVDRRRMAIAEVNRAACVALGYSRRQLLRMRPRQICRPDDLAELARRLDEVPVEEPAAVVLRTIQRRKDGIGVPSQWHVSRFWNAGNEIWIIVARQISTVAPDGLPEGRAVTTGLGLPGYDPLTGLPDRRLFERRLGRALERARDSSDYLFAVCFLDLDRFKTVNDSLGHLAGDRLLCEVARRLVGCVRPDDMVARFGGDEFIIFVDHLRRATDAAIVARRILDRMQSPIVVDGRPVKIAASIGIAPSSTAWERIEDLLRHADRAMYHAKANGGGEFVLCEQGAAARSAKPR